MTPAQLVAATGCLTEDANRIARPLTDVMQPWGITGRLRVAAFLAQVAHESARFQRLEENLNYTDPARLMVIFPSRFTRYDTAMQYVLQPAKLANHVYADRLGNGSEASGDGWRYRGRGLPQLTGRDNYAAFGDEIGEPILVHPDLVAQPGYACLAAAWIWKRADANTLADADRFDQITRCIAGRGMTGAQDRRLLYARALAALAKPPGVTT